MRRRKSRAARLQMTCPEKHRERDRFTGNENRDPKRTFNFSPKETQTTPHAATGRENLNVLLQKSKKRSTLSRSTVFF